MVCQNTKVRIKASSMPKDMIYQDIRVLLDSTSKMMDGKKLTDIKLPLSASIAQKTMMKKVSGTVIEELLKKYNLI